MMRRHLFWCASLLFLLINTASAEFYAGAGVGSMFGSITSKMTYPANVSNPTVATYNNALVTFTPQIALGYHHPIKERWGIDAVFNTQLNLGNNTTKVQNWFVGTDASVSTSVPMAYAFDLLATYELNAAVTAFIGPGVTLDQFKTTSTTTGGNVGISGTYNKNLVGGQLMFGVDLFQTHHIVLRLSDQVSILPNASTSWTEPLSDESVAGQYTMTTNTLMATVLFHF